MYTAPRLCGVTPRQLLWWRASAAPLLLLVCSLSVCAQPGQVVFTSLELLFDASHNLQQVAAAEVVSPDLIPVRNANLITSAASIRFAIATARANMTRLSAADLMSADAELTELGVPTILTSATRDTDKAKILKKIKAAKELFPDSVLPPKIKDLVDEILNIITKIQNLLGS